MSENGKKGKGSMDISRRDFLRLASTGVMACAAVTAMPGGRALAADEQSKVWVGKEPGIFEQEVAYVGMEKAERGYPIKSIIDYGGVLGSHSDFPVSPVFSVPWTVCLGAIGYLPYYGKSMIRHADQCLSRLDTLKALTINVAYMWYEEERMGSLETGKLANLTVFDKDFMRDDFKDIENAKCLATYVDGELVYNV